MASRFEQGREARGEDDLRGAPSQTSPPPRPKGGSWTDAFPHDYHGWGPQTDGQGLGDTGGAYADPEEQRNWRDYPRRPGGFEHHDRPGQARFHGYMSNPSPRLRQDAFDRTRDEETYAGDERFYGRSRHDEEYLAWRAEQLRKLDEDYEAFRQERRTRFGEEFTSWRMARQRPEDNEPIGDRQAKARAKSAIGSDKLDVTGADKNVTGSAGDLAARGA